MSPTYLLPCSCGKELPVRPHQAGEMLECSCGATLEVPTVLQMSRLRQAPPESEAQQPTTPWDLRQSMILLGLVIALLGIVLTVSLFLNRPPLPDVETVRRQVDAYSPVESWRRWHVLRAVGPDPRSRKYDELFAKAVFRHRLWMGVTLTLTTGGIVLATLARMQGRRRRH